MTSSYGDGLAVELRGVCREFPGGVRALDGVDLAVEAGAFVAVMGVSGSGKSTLLHILGLLDRPTAGSYRLWGRDTAGMTEAQQVRLRAGRIGFVFQDHHLVSYLTVAENVALACAYAGVPTGERAARVEGALAAVGLATRRDAVPSTLSGGERQRVAIARAIAPDPDLLLCDEPTGNLDVENTRRFLELLEATRRPGRTTVVATHDPEVAGVAERVIRLEGGRCAP